ncbi:DUF4238 domain-containing protein [Xanthomonas campestris]|uniref:DUF4238 domain-containing protein n=1 Tax=Xanthomonas campestris TaxID=339 RepID=UPI00094B46C1|nr:DUF4238 domain-containing protein [Xanthomonas campestris]
MTSTPSPGKLQRPSRENHYVPEWYQRGFRVADADNWLLDIAPPHLRPDGTPILARPRQRPPKACFWQNDLYITRFGEYLNDQIETVLFQGIDDSGAAAVRAFISGNVVQVHDQYQPMLAYLGAQKLRTPKGLEWIRSRYPALSQLELMREMQHLRQMFGTLWAECAHEVVSAEDSVVKFLITDHPVTTFNAGLALDASLLDYPNEAPVTWNGTQTLFPLDANHLLILKYSPVDSPAQHKQQFLKNIMFWLMLEPLIRAGKVLVFPDPSDLSPEFEHAMRTMARERTAQWRLEPQQLDEFRWLLRDDLKRSMLQLPDRVLLSLVKDAAPDQGEEHYLGTVAYMRRQGEKDPMALLQVLEDEKTLDQLFVVRCVNLEVALFMAQSTDAVIVTDVRALWDHLHLHTRAAQATAPAPTDGVIALNAALNPFDALAVDATEGAAAVRAVLSGLRAAADAGPSSGAVSELVETFRASCAALGQDVPITREELQVAMHLTPSVPPSGFESPTAQRLLVAFGRERAPVTVGLALFRRTDGDAPRVDDDDSD